MIQSPSFIEKDFVSDWHSTYGAEHHFNNPLLGTDSNVPWCSFTTIRLSARACAPTTGHNQGNKQLSTVSFGLVRLLRHVRLIRPNIFTSRW